MPYQLTKLPYALDALQPHISQETLRYHYGKHHQGYVRKLNELTKGTELDELPLIEIVLKSSGEVFNNAAQVWNHNFYWFCLSPEGGKKPNGALAKAIDVNFGSFEQFQEQFTKAAVATFGSGWTWLVRKPLNSELAIESTSNAETPAAGNRVALLACDVWEHAYYIDYRNERANYLEAFWKVIAWDFVAANYATV